MIRILALVCIISAGLLIQTTTAQSTAHVTLPDTLRMECDSSEGAIYTYRVRPKETLYSISKAFETDVFRLNELNPWLNDRILGIGDTLIVPLKEKIVLPERIPNGAIPVYYTVETQDNLFRICRVCSGIHERKILNVNHKDGPQIAPGEELLMGYFIPGIRDTSQHVTVKGDIDRREQQSYKGAYSEKGSQWRMVSDRGVAVWNRSKSGGSNYYVLHKTAPVNSIMEVVNPMNHRKVYAKVVGNLPKNTYPEEVIAVVSPAVANFLGVLDPRFYVHIRYKESLAEVSRR